MCPPPQLWAKAWSASFAVPVGLDILPEKNAPALCSRRWLYRNFARYWRSTMLDGTRFEAV